MTARERTPNAADAPAAREGIAAEARPGRFEDGACDAEFSCSEEAARLLDARADALAGQRRRERVALGVFGVLVLAGFVVLTSYISNAGQGLTAAATNIDDIAGDMQGYDVVLFKGTVHKDSSSDDASSSKAKSDEGSSKGGVTSFLFGGAGEDSSDASEASSSDGGADETETDAVSSEDDGAMTVDEARAIYEGKKASVLEVDPDDLRDYASGRIIMKDGHSYGIFSLTPDMVSEFSMPKTTTTKTTTTTTERSSGSGASVDAKTTTRVKNAYDSVSDLFADINPDQADPELTEHIETILARFEAAHVDTVVALTSDPTPFAFVDGVDAVITFKTQDRFSMSEVIGGTLYFDAPEQGSVGVLMIAPGNVASTKVLSAD